MLTLRAVSFCGGISLYEKESRSANQLRDLRQVRGEFRHLGR